jgi:hypothetical protein
MTTTIHPSHAANMTAKAIRLARFLSENVTPNPDVVAELDAIDWKRIADLAGERRTPSLATCAAPVELLRARQPQSEPAPAPTRWIREHAGGYFSDCGRYFIERFVGCECGPWIVRCDPNGKQAGFGRIIVRHADTMRECKDDVAAHVEHGDDFWHHIPYGHVRTDGPERDRLKAHRRGEVEYWRRQLPAEGIDLAALADPANDWLRYDAVKIIRATYLTEAAAKRIVAELACAEHTDPEEG